VHTLWSIRKNSGFSTQEEHLGLLGVEALTNALNLRYATRSKYLSRLRKLDHAIVLKVGFEP